MGKTLYQKLYKNHQRQSKITRCQTLQSLRRINSLYNLSFIMSPYFQALQDFEPGLLFYTHYNLLHRFNNIMSFK